MSLYSPANSNLPSFNLESLKVLIPKLKEEITEHAPLTSLFYENVEKIHRLEMQWDLIRHYKLILEEELSQTEHKTETQQSQILNLDNQLNEIGQIWNRVYDLCEEEKLSNLKRLPSENLLQIFSKLLWRVLSNRRIDERSYKKLFV